MSSSWEALPGYNSISASRAGFVPGAALDAYVSLTLLPCKMGTMGK